MRQRKHETDKTPLKCRLMWLESGREGKLFQNLISCSDWESFSLIASRLRVAYWKPSKNANESLAVGRWFIISNCRGSPCGERGLQMHYGLKLFSGPLFIARIIHLIFASTNFHKRNRRDLSGRKIFRRKLCVAFATFRLCIWGSFEALLIGW